MAFIPNRCGSLRRLQYIGQTEGRREEGETLQNTYFREKAKKRKKKKINQNYTIWWSLDEPTSGMEPSEDRAYWTGSPEDWKHSDSSYSIHLQTAREPDTR